MVAKSKLAYIVLSVLAVVALTGCGASKDVEKKKDTPNYASEVKEKPIVTITMENDKKIVMELYPEVAPNTVANFVSLVKEGFYDGLIFHRVIPGFMVQGGDPTGNGTGGPDYAIKGEFLSNGFENNLKHDRGVVSMARSQDPNSAGSQFFIMVDTSEQLDGEYAAFGKVTEGMDVVDEIVNAERNESDKPLKEQKMKKVEVDTKGFDYPNPEVQK
ncbi:peptidylprolyl isomerase [Viridibacillus sp. FSL H7-0596]|uniref:peptidylprolyl isomerase n=1 Tax=Viridibacillus sp. FSL H7-0596 TaxID=1928923 RepID=UPI00096ED147|nr:peptidylprolyl isomerase [Viridibacillus sp. FSL H7-0596]OMC86523.1 peptidylprolyl isomerase [Viridibacillus sp. FSL H7-0596]